MEFDDVLKSVGEFGIYQRVFVAFLCSISTFPSLFVFTPIFMTGEPDHWCAVPALDHLNLTEEVLKNLTIPYVEHAGTFVYDQCQMYDRNYTGWNVWQVEWCLANPGDCNAETTPCQDGWIYDQSLYTSTITTQFDLVCERSWYQPTVSSVYTLGSAGGVLIFGLLSDKFGRRRAVISTYLGMLLMVFGWPFSPIIELMLVLRCLTGFFTPAFLAECIGVEIVGPTSRHHVVAIWNYGWALGYMLSAVIAYFVRDWFILHMICAFICLMHLPFIWFTPESPRWFYTVNKTLDGDNAIKRMAKINGHVCPNPIQIKTPEVEKTSGIWEILRTPKIRWFFIILIVQMCFISISYLGMSYNSPNLGGNIFTNVFFSGLAEMVGYALSHVSLQLTGRKISFAAYNLLAGIMLFSAAAVPADLVELILTFNLIARIFTTMGMCIHFVLAADILPTEMRASGCSLVMLFGFIGMAVSPYISLLADIATYVPLLVFGALSCIVGLLAIPLPETRGAYLNDTLKQISAKEKSGNKDTDLKDESKFNNGYENDITFKKQKTTSMDDLCTKL